MLTMIKALKVVNRLRDEGLISQYAIGGAVAAVFYIEPTQTQDIDIFVHLEPPPGSLLVTTKPITDRLQELGYSEWHEDKLQVENWPIQFLPASKPMEVEAIEYAVEKTLSQDLVVRVPPPEYLMLIALDLRRPKDVLRLQQFYMEQAYDPVLFKTLLEKYKLTNKWQKLEVSFSQKTELEF